MERPIELRISDGRMAFGDVPEHIDQRLQAAVAARTDPKRCEELLWEAHRLGPRVLPVFYALYKFYFSKLRLNDAERVALIGLDAAAAQGGYPADWRALTAGSTDWDALGMARFTLFTLKALAFISLRRGNAEQAAAILAKLAEVNPADHVGWRVVEALARGDGEEE